MEPPRPPSTTTLLLISLILAGIGWIGFLLVIFLSLPTLFPRWLFFFFLCMATTGTVMPEVGFLNRRFPSNPPAGGGVIVRQSMWFGFYVSLCAWLQMGRALNSTVMLFILGGFVIIEVFLRIAETTRFKPKETPPDEQ